MLSKESRERKTRVFVFDDDPGVLGLVAAALNRFDEFEVFSFRCAEECSVGCSEHPCADAIISDVRMPGMGGLEFVKHLRDVGCPISNVLLMSGCWVPDDIEEANALGCEVIRKPFHLKDLAAVCSRWANEVDVGLDPGPPRYLECNSPVAI